MSGPPEETPADVNPYQSPVVAPAELPAGQPGAIPWGQKPFPGIGGAILLVLLITALQCAGGVGVAIVTGAVQALEIPLEPSDVMGLGMAAVQFMAFVPAIVLGCVLARRPAREVLPLGSFPFLVLVPMVVAAVGLVILVSECDNLTRSVLPMPDELAEMFRDLFEGGVGTFVALVIVAPLVEELLFRGVILTGFLARYRRGTAIGASAVLFAVAHLNPYQFAAGLVTGVFLGWLLVRTRSLWPCILVHAAFNAHVVLVPVLRDQLGVEIPGFTAPPEAAVVEFQPAWFNALGLVLAAAGTLGVAALTARPRAAPEGGPAGA